MNKKYFLLILLCVMALLPGEVNATYPDSSVTSNIGNCVGECGGNTGNDGGPYTGKAYLYADNGELYLMEVKSSSCTVTNRSCNPRFGIYSVTYGTSADIYDMYNNEIIENGVFTKPVIAGTYFGANLYEWRTYQWWSRGTEDVTLTCRIEYEYESCWTSCNKSGTVCDHGCETKTQIYYVTNYTSGWSPACQAQADQAAYSYAKSLLEKNGASYTVSITDPNDVRCNYPEKYADELVRENIVCNNYNVASTSSEITSFEESVNNGGKVTKYYYYEMYGACINAKTSKVRYIDKNEKCTEDEYFVENDYVDDMDKKHWHVFTPINTKETEGYTLIFNSNTKSVMDGGVCQEYVKKYADNFEYALYIRPTSGTFTYNLDADRKKVAHGCYYYLKIQIPTVQKFYGEEITETTDILKGFNFYYRPIDINNPFPNGINDDSYWKEWRDSEKKEPDIEESFNEITYWTSGIDLNEIRDYNYENTYLDWETMEINGFSTFITGKNFLNRRSTITPLKVYSLGCAPTNMCEYYINKNGERVENPIYQPECKDTRDMVVCP